MENNPRQKVYAYLRKSTKQEKEGSPSRQANSLAYQRKAVQEIASKHNLVIVRQFEDKESGYKAFIRKNFSLMCELIESGEEGVTGIVCSEHNRLARNFADGGMILWYLQNGEVKNIYTHDKIFSNGASDQMMLAINFAMGKNSSDETSYRIKSTFDVKFDAGTPPNQRIPGYKYVGDDGKKVWQKNPRVAPLVVKVFEAYATGDYTIPELLEYATSIGLTNPDTKKPYVANTVRSWLIKKEYIGIFAHRGEVKKGIYPPILTEELFYKVQEMLIQRSHKRGKTKNVYAYSPKVIKCSLCKEYLTGDVQKGNVYYKCQCRKEPCKSDKSKRHPHLKESFVDTTVQERLKEVEISEEKWKELKVLIKENSQHELGEYEKQVRELRTKIKYAEEEKKEYAKSLSKLRNKVNLSESEIHEMEGYSALITDANNMIEIYNRTITKSKDIIDQIPLHLEGFLDTLKTATSRFDQATPTNKRDIVETICANIEWDGEKVVWEWKNKYKKLLEGGESTKWLCGQDSNLQPTG